MHTLWVPVDANSTYESALRERCDARRRHADARAGGRQDHQRRSVQSELARATIAPYTATKGALKSLTRGMCADWAPHGICVNAIGPGYFDTELNAALRADPAFDGWLRRRTPGGRWGELEELVGVTVFLAAPASDSSMGRSSTSTAGSPR